MAGILEKMGVKNKKELKTWQERERQKLAAITRAFEMQTEDKVEITCNPEPTTGDNNG